MSWRPSKTTVTIAATVVVFIAAVSIAVTSLRYHDRQAAAGGTLAAKQAAAGSTASESPPSSTRVPKVVEASLPSAGFRYLGVYEGSDPSASQYASIEQFATAVGTQPNIVLFYSGWGEGFSTQLAQTALTHGATMLIDIDPTDTTAAAIAAGRQDPFLRSYAESVKAFGHPVILSFGHEMNGTWYSWGWTHTSPATFVAAWRHVVDVFRDEGADNVTWLWTVNALGEGEGPIADYWPGSNYVTWVGLDAYYYETYDNFNGVFGSSIAAIRQVTNEPILISETAIGQVAGQAANIPGLFAGIAADGLLGFVWFDEAQNDGIYKQDWRLEGHPYAIAAFRSAAAAYLK